MEDLIVNFSHICPICNKKSNNFKEAILAPFIADRAFGFRPLQIDKSWKLRDIKKTTSYFPSDSVYCKKCNFLFSSIRFDNKQLDKIYSNYRKKKYNFLRSKYEKNYRQRDLDLHKGYAYLKDVESYISNFLKNPSAILDWGGDDGKNTPFKNKLKKFHIFDISEVKPKFNAKKISKSLIKKNNYDLVVCAHVLEHIPNIRQFLFNMKNSIKKSTYVYFEIPHEYLMQKSSLNSCPNKRHWHEHINFFSPLSLKKVLEYEKFKVIDVTSTLVQDWNKNKLRIIQAFTKI